MSLRLEMLQVARLAPKVLGEAAGLVHGFLNRQQNEDGGFMDRAGKSDLYYTVFGIDGLLALQTELPAERITSYLRRFDDGEGLDFVHLCCLARGWAAIQARDLLRDSPTDASSWKRAILKRIASFRTPDGGFHPLPHQPYGTAYGCFLGLGAYQDLNAEFPEPTRLVECLASLKTADGVWANERGLKTGSTNATAAAVSVSRALSVPVDPVVGDWLLARCHADGGFLAMPVAPLPDLLSTATALHALAGLGVPFESVKEPCLDFVDSLWTNEGSFHGNWTDEHLDCEYTFYGLLALGHLSL